MVAFFGNLKKIVIKMHKKEENVGLEAPNCWTRTRFLGVNPKDSTRTLLVLDTLRLVLDSYSQKVDSTHH